MTDTAEHAIPPPTSRRIPWLRVLALALPPLVLGAWLTVPYLGLPARTVQGQAAPGEYCLAGCSPVLKVGGLLLGCKAEPLGLSAACPSGLPASGEVVATYVALPSLSSLLGLSRVDGTLTRLERGGQLVYARSVGSVVWDTLEGPSLFHLIYWPLAAFIIWRWPHSRFSRRATWRDDAR